MHPHVVTVYDAGEEGTRPFLVMELVRGPNLARVVKARGPLSGAESVTIAAQMLDALAAAHDLGWLHRDVKPSNVLFVDATTIKLTDFGLAKSMHDVAGGITRPGQVLGTPMYLAPEQSRGRRTTPSSDLYSVGIVLFQMLTGGVPYSGKNLVDIAIAHQEAPVPPVLRDDIPDALAVAVARAMAKDPLDRFPSARAMQAALLASVATPSSRPGRSRLGIRCLPRIRARASWPQSVRGPPGGEHMGRNRWIVVVVCLAVVAAACGRSDDSGKGSGSDSTTSTTAARARRPVTSAP